MPTIDSLIDPWAVIAVTGCGDAASGANLDYALLPGLDTGRNQWATGLLKISWDGAWLIINNGTPLFAKAAGAVWPWSAGEWTPINGASGTPALARKNAVPARWNDPRAVYAPSATVVPAWLLAFDRIYINAQDEVCFVIGETEKYLPANTRPYQP